MKDDLSQIIHRNMFFSLYINKNIANIILPFCQKTKITFSWKNTPKGDISGVTGKDDIHPKKYDISVEISYWLTFHIKILESVPIVLCTFMKTFTGVYIYCFPVKKTPKT